ncbi:Uma2 family endonuclease [candidate division KSB1 bacterium]|nr:MAG: Uma2 family endonuclease [candidate division KSB1 bacterium]MBC6951632.1 Uma2 family endonuclease [candidate division KSB1 bacterium]MCE7942174.1 Uma2 family endonuclease [Chlorobi bacterium CHB1]MDL1876841.1 Uma2 family endonuclease [Cytophagia bacterium CHB2]
MSVNLTSSKKIDFAEYLALPETMQRYEIIDGEIIMAPAPTARHQIVLGNLYRALFSFVSKRRLGFVLFAPLDVVVRRKPRLRTRQPDLIFVSTARQHLVGDRIDGAPDLAVEILSPEETRHKIAAKLKDYCRIGVRECWLVSLEAETIEVLRLSTGKAKRLDLYDFGDVVRSEVLPDLALSTKKMFA